MSYETSSERTPEEIIIDLWGEEELIKFVDRGRSEFLNEKINLTFREWYDRENSAGRVRSFEDFGAYLGCTASTANRYYNGRILNTDYSTLDGYLRCIGTSLQKVLPTETEFRVYILSLTLKQFMIARGISPSEYESYLPLDDNKLNEIARLVDSCPLDIESVTNRALWRKWLRRACETAEKQVGAIRWRNTGGAAHLTRPWVKAIAAGDWQAVQIHLPWQVLAILTSVHVAAEAIKLTGGAFYTAPPPEDEEVMTTTGRRFSGRTRVCEMQRKCELDTQFTKKVNASARCIITPPMRQQTSSIAEIKVSQQIPLRRKPGPHKKVHLMTADELASTYVGYSDRGTYEPVVRHCTELIVNWLKVILRRHDYRCDITLEMDRDSVAATATFALRPDELLVTLKRIQSAIVEEANRNKLEDFSDYYWSGNWKDDHPEAILRIGSPVQPAFGDELLHILGDIEYIAQWWDLAVITSLTALRALTAFDKSLVNSSTSSAIQILSEHGVVGEILDGMYPDLIKQEVKVGDVDVLYFEDYFSIAKRWTANPPFPRRHYTVRLLNTLKEMQRRRFITGCVELTDNHLALQLIDDKNVSRTLTEKFGINCDVLQHGLHESAFGGQVGAFVHACFNYS